VEYNENPEDAAVRELKEECGIDGTTCGLIAVRGSPGRDPRKHTVTVCYAIAVNDFSSLQAGDDAAAAFFVPLSSLETASMAFDHGPLAQQASEWLYKRGGRQMLVNVFEQHRNAASS
jgi:8-oxo-dGTP diphosphatase